MDRNETVRISRLAAFGGLTESDANIGTQGCDVFVRNQKVQKKRNMIFGHIGVYWVRSWQKLTS